jgi:hypothetical protein
MPIAPDGTQLPYPEDFGAAGADPLMALLGGGGAPPAEPDVPQTPEGILREILRLFGEYRQVEKDDEDLLAAEQATTLIQRLLAANQKAADGMMGGTMSPRAMRRAGSSMGGP